MRMKQMKLLVGSAAVALLVTTVAAQSGAWPPPVKLNECQTSNRNAPCYLQSCSGGVHTVACCCRDIGVVPLNWNCVCELPTDCVTDSNRICNQH